MWNAIKYNLDLFFVFYATVILLPFLIPTVHVISDAAKFVAARLVSSNGAPTAA